MSGVRRVAVVPSTLALLPSYAGAVDPVPALREASYAAARWLLDDGTGPAEVLTTGPRPDNAARGVEEPAGWRVGRELLGAGAARPLAPGAAPTAGALLVVANGSATRSERAPGHLDERAAAFDATIARGLADGDPTVLAGLDAGLGEQLWCFDVPSWVAFGRSVPVPVAVSVDHDDDPFGVQYWVARWTCGS